MKSRTFPVLFSAALVLVTWTLRAQPGQADSAYHVLRTEKVGGQGGWDYVFADAAGRHLYVPRGDRVTVYDLDSLQPAGVIPNTNSVHGVAIDPASGHAFCSSRPVVMWDARSLQPLKTIPVQGGPDGILFEPFTERLYILSHRAPNVTVLNAKTGDIVGTIDLGAAPEQAASDGKGRVYIDLEDKDQVAVVDASSLAVVGHYELGGKARTPAGLSLDAEHHVLFVCCRNPGTAVILDAGDGHLITSLPIGSGVDAAEFNAATGEAISSQGDGTLTIIKEDSPTAFHVEQTVPTRAGARTSSLDAKTGHIFLVTAERVSTPAAAATATPTAGERRGGRPQMVPGSFTLVEVGR